MEGLISHEKIIGLDFIIELRPAMKGFNKVRHCLLIHSQKVNPILKNCIKEKPLVIEEPLFYILF
ncbi:hypothetical protein IM40_01070 [Candidatus Paracaedimonas acanthamoebae]|nr:hypothetical protein IM40_01070 [Candidatus Paracaedimonas acanthamoebae]